MKRFTYPCLFAAALAGSTVSTVAATEQNKCICEVSCGCTSSKKTCCQDVCKCIEMYGSCDCEHTKELPASISAEIAYGELVDKITILEIKTERISDKAKLENVWKELTTLQAIYTQLTQSKPTHVVKLSSLKKELRTINETLWNIEDTIRTKEAKKSFDTEFIELARSVYRTNDKRCAIKREINELLGSPLIEEKSYEDYE